VAADFSKLTDEQVALVASGKARAADFAPKSEKDFSQLSDDQVASIAEGKSKYEDFISPKTGKPMPSIGKTIGANLEDVAALGGRAGVAGVGGAIGQTIYDVGKAERPGSLSEAIETMKRIGGNAKQAFFDTRDESRQELKDISDARPGLALGTKIAGTVATAPLMAARGLQGLIGAGKVGTMYGAGDALSNADSATDAVERIATGTGTGMLLHGGGTALTKGVQSAASTKVGQKVIEGVKSAGSKLAALPGQAALKTAAALTGFSEQEIKTYAQQTSKVNEIIQKSGGKISEAADRMREKLQTSIRGKRQELSGKIGSALEQSSAERNIDVNSIIKGLEASKDKINTTYGADQIKEIDDMIAMIQKENPNGLASIKSLHELKEFLQDSAKSSYAKGGQIFSRGRDAARGAKTGAAEAKRIFDKVAPEGAVHANQQLFRLHRMEDSLNKNLIAPGKSESALLAAGRGENQRAEIQLEGLGKMVGSDALGDAQKLAAAKSFGNIPLFPKDATGKAVGRMAAGAGIGYAADGTEGAAIGTALTSPLALKIILNGANVLRGAGAASAGTVSNIAEGVRKQLMSNKTVAEALTKIPSAEAQRAYIIQLMQRETNSMEKVRAAAKGEEPIAENAMERRMRTSAK
jgi:hypothetical protein